MPACTIEARALLLLGGLGSARERDKLAQRMGVSATV
jgi:hypothetical protein